MQIAQSKTRAQFPLSYKKIIKKTIGSMIGWSVVLIIMFVPLIISFVGLASAIPPVPGQPNPSSLVVLAMIVALFVFLLIFFVTYIYQKWYFSVYFYDLTNDYIMIRKGPITPREITIPYERLQDVYVDQDLLDRIFGLYDVHLSSATVSSGMEAHIDGVEKQAADGLRAILLQTIKERISKHSGKNVVPDSPTTQSL